MFIARADFISYNNSLGSCCASESDSCSENCDTVLQYCFKNDQTVNSIDENSSSLSDCLHTRKQSGIIPGPVEYIDYSMPPQNNFGMTISSSFGYISGDDWPVCMLCVSVCL